MTGRPKQEPKLRLTFYLSPKTQDLLNCLTAGKIKINDEGNRTKNVKESFQLLEETERLLEILQRDSKDRKDKKSKGWFIDQAIEYYVATDSQTFFQQQEKDQTSKGKKKTKSTFVEEALRIKYKQSFDLLKTPTIKD